MQHVPFQDNDKNILKYDKYHIIVIIVKKQSSRSVMRGPIIFLQSVIVLTGTAVLALLLIEPSLEGRNAHATLFQIYFTDPFLAYAYVASIPFFVALFQAFKLFAYIGKNKVFSQAAINTVRTIKYCAFITSGAVMAAMIYLKIASLSNTEDAAGAIMLESVAIFVSIVIGTVAAVFQKTLRRAVDKVQE